MPRKKSGKLKPKPTEPINPRAPEKPEPRDLRKLEERALRELWPIPPEHTARIVDRLMEMVAPRKRPKKGVEPTSGSQVIRASRTLLAASLGQQRIDLVRERGGVIGRIVIDADVIAEVEAADLEFEAERARIRDRERKGKPPE